jgi:hypothetical protein
VKYLVHPVNADSLVKHYFGMLGIDLVDAWVSEAMQDLMFGMGPAELNRPFPKAPSVYAFPEFWRCGGWLRGNESLQVVGGIRDFHDELLASRFNRTGAKTVVALYADLVARLVPC